MILLAAALLTGHVAVVDGDTLRLAGQRVRLAGIDAPERRQTCRAGGRRLPCGYQATAALRRLVAGRRVRCSPQGRDRYQRVLAICFVGKIEINAALVRLGWALAYRRYSLRYAAAEQAARRERRGIWQTEFEAPWTWRHSHR